jgi:Fur family ferric uptake transcriptional regulator
MSESAKSFQDYLSDAGFKGTRQRELVARTFFGLGRHVSAHDLYREVRRRNKRIGLVTVYRTLKLLRDAGLADERRFTRDFSLFEPKPRRHHDHMICVRCGEIVEFENETIEDLQEEAARRAGFTIISHKLELYGKCRKCQARS